LLVGAIISVRSRHALLFTDTWFKELHGIMNKSSLISRREALTGFASAGAAALLGSRMLSASDVNETPVHLGEQPGYYRFQVGDIEAVALYDGGFSVLTEGSPMGQNEPLELKEKVLKDAFLPTDMLQMSFKALLMKLGADLVLVDAGCGGLYGPMGGQLLGNLKAAEVSPEQVGHVIITHMHGDHFGGLLDAEGNPVFRNAKLYIHEKEYEFWNGSASDYLGEDYVSTSRRYFKAFEGQWNFVKGGDRLLPGLEVVDAFGHTPGHMMLDIRSGEERLLNMADVAHHHALSFAYPEWLLKFDVLKEMGMETRSRLLTEFAEERVRVFGGHMPFPGLGHVRRRAGGNLEYVIEPWQR